jgi:phosphoesterase RecJ-like protein
MYFPEHSETFRSVLNELGDRPIAILGHLRPDGDCIGSQVGLARVLQAMGKDIVCYNHHVVPPNCRSFVGDTPYLLDTEAKGSERVAISVDCADHKRMGTTLSEQFSEIHLNIDHHISNTHYGLRNIVDGSASAAGELLAGMFFDIGLPMDSVAAQALYIGIATDTGQFRYSSTTRRTFDICCKLMDKGAEPAVAANHLYEHESPAKLALLQRFLASFQFYYSGRLCVGRIDEAAWEATGASKEDTEGLVDYARSIAGVEIGVLLEEREGHLKGSFRAKDPCQRVDLLAAQFNGGGHACAAGFNPGCDFATFYPRFLEVMEAHFTSNSAVN